MTRPLAPLLLAALCTLAAPSPSFAEAPARALLFRHLGAVAQREPGVARARRVSADHARVLRDTGPLVAAYRPTRVVLAQAGADRTVTDRDGNGRESVALDGRGSFSPDGVRSYEWRMAGRVVSTEPAPTLAFRRGSHRVALRVTDGSGRSDLDEVLVRVVANQPPRSRAGSDQILLDLDEDGAETVTLGAGAASDPEGGPLTFAWWWRGRPVSREARPTLRLPAGAHWIRLEVRDDGRPALAGTDLVRVIVARVRRVPGDHATLQEAVDAAGHGDRVLVGPGTWSGPGNRDVDLRGKGVELRAAEGPERTTLDCQGQGRGFVLATDETRWSAIHGFTVTGGAADEGGAIRLVDTFALVSGCVLAANQASRKGGAIVCRMGAPRLSGNLIRDNVAGQEGGGIACFVSSDAEILDNRLLRNRAPAGAAISVGLVSAPRIAGNLAHDNTASRFGGAVSVMNGGHRTVHLANNTLAANFAQNQGGGLYLYDAGAVELANTLLWGNRAAGDGDQVQVLGNSQLAVRYSIVAGGMAGEGNRDADPQFADPASGDYRLKATSPAIDAADGDLAPALDLEGRPRADAPKVADTGRGAPPWADIGAFEWQPQ